MTTITSNKNVQFRQWCDLLEGRGIKKHQLFLLSGRKTVPEILQQNPRQVNAVLVSGDTSQISVPHHVPVFNLTAPLFREIDESGTNFPILVMNVPTMDSIDLTAPPQGLEIICALGDPLNVGALIRVASAFDVSRLILLTESATPFHSKAVRSSSGTVLSMVYRRGPSLKELHHPEILKHLVVFDQSGQNLTQFKWPQNVRILIGEEGPGLPEELRQKNLAAQTVCIPISSKVESLNAVSAASIALYSYRCTYN